MNNIQLFSWANREARRKTAYQARKPMLPSPSMKMTYFGKQQAWKQAHKPKLGKTLPFAGRTFKTNTGCKSLKPYSARQEIARQDRLRQVRRLAAVA